MAGSTPPIRIKPAGDRVIQEAGTDTRTSKMIQSTKSIQLVSTFGGVVTYAWTLEVSEGVAFWAAMIPTTTVGTPG